MGAFSFSAAAESLGLPFRRRPRSRLERLRHDAAVYGQRVSEATRHAFEERRIPVEPPDLSRITAAARQLLADHQIAISTDEIARATAALRQAVADRGLTVEAPEFLRSRLGLAASAVTPPQPGLRGRLTAEENRRWLILTAALAGFAAGIGAAVWLSRRHAAVRERARELQQAADEIKAAWPEVGDDDIERARGSADRLARVIRERTGQDPDTVRERLTGMTTRSESAEAAAE